MGRKKLANTTSLIASFALNLTGPVIKQFSKPVAFASLYYDRATDSLLYSPFRSREAAVGAISLNSSLVPIPDCGLFTNGQFTVSNTGLSARGLNILVENAPLTVTDNETGLNDSSFSPEEFSLASVALCGAPCHPPR